MILKRTSLYIGSWLYNNITNKQKEKMKNDNKELTITELQNKVKVLLLYITVAATLILTAWIFDIWKDILLSFVTFAIARWWNGGHHFAIDWCYIVTNGVIIGSIPLSYIIGDYSMITLAIALILNLIYAPFDKHHEKFYLKKIISLLICIAAYYVDGISMAMVFILSFDLIRKGGIGS